MAHRAEQILQAAAAAIAEQTDVGASVFDHRTLSLSADDQELPAVCINFGSDNPLSDTGYTNLAFIDSSVQLILSYYAQARTQKEVATELMRLRSVGHRAMLASPQTLGLSFVMGIAYGGADTPDFSTDSSPLAGQLDCAYTVQYRANLTDPD